MADFDLDWVKLKFRNWISGTQELDGISELVFWRLCLLSYDTGTPEIVRSAVRLATWCKVSAEQFQTALDVLAEVEKISVEATEDGKLRVYVFSTEKIMGEATGALEARQMGAAKARRIKQLKIDRKSPQEIDRIIAKEFPPASAKPAEKGEGGDLFNGTAPQISEVDQAFDLWNAFATANDLPKVIKRDDQTRRSRLRARLKDAGGLEGIRLALEKSARNSFLMGKRHDFQMDFDFFTRKKQFTKIIEGSYRPDQEIREGVSEILTTLAKLQQEDDDGQ